MPLNTRIALITEADLQGLVDQEENESRTLDYKEMITLSGDATTSFRKDVTAFANSNGGDIVVGIRDVEGRPAELCGFEIDNMTEEQYVMRLTDILQSRIKPRVQGIKIQTLLLSNGRYACIVRVPRSYGRPHQIEVGTKDFQFWLRHDRSNQRMDIDDLRAVIALSEGAAERVKNFRMDRISRIMSGETPRPMEDGPKLVMHLVPLNAFDVAAEYDLANVAAPGGNQQALTPIYDTVPILIPNFEGIVATNASTLSTTSGSYVQVFRNGIIEACVQWFFSRDQGTIDMWSFEDMQLRVLPGYLSYQEACGVSLPIFLIVSFLGADGYTIWRNAWGRDMTFRNPIAPKNLFLPEQAIEDFSVDPCTVFRPIFDRIWNAAGVEKSLTFDEDGVRLPRRFF